MSAPLLLLSLNNHKTAKSVRRGYLTGILHLVPSDWSGVVNLCPHASAGCRAACFYTWGRALLPSVRAAWLRRTHYFRSLGGARFVDLLAQDIEVLAHRAAARRLRLAVRLNGTSDIPWERIAGTDGRTIFERFAQVRFYDYTKRPARDARFPNYALTFSRSEANEAHALAELARGRNVAVVFATRKGQALPKRWQGYRVVDGDASDLRFLDPSGVVVGLRAKGRGRTDRTGFVVHE